MSFDISIQTNNSEKIRLDKDLTTIATLTGTLRNDTSIIDPTFIIEGDISDYLAANYCTVESFGRSYFINNIRSLRANLFEIACHVDVLSSFKTQIRANKAIVRKSENVWNLYLNDGSLQAYQYPKVFTTPFPQGFTDCQYILIVAGG